ncbi:hypothetical protein I4U23_019427 [Adineta vaga]|nr:hypothetical protein I4U23_019427 [Adineta vaga]
MELTVMSIRSDNRQPPVITQQPHPLYRWWMRHHMHIGLASMAGSAILSCVIAVILLPIAVQKPSEEEEQCNLSRTPITRPYPWSTQSPFPQRNITVGNRSSPVIFDRLCASNASWRTRANTIAGSSNDTDSLSRTNLRNPNDILIDFDGSLFIADSNNNRIAYWSVNATEGFIVVGTGAVGSWINLLKYAAAIVDLDNYRVMAFPYSTIEGAPDGVTIVGHYGAGSALNQINAAYYLCVDTIRQILYLSDSGNHRILKLNSADYTLQLVVGTGMINSDNVSLNLPLGLAVDEITGALYVADSQNHRIQKFDLKSKEGLTVAGGKGSGQGLSQLFLPSGVTIDTAGNIYIADTGNHRIIQWLVGADQGRLIAGTGISGNSDILLNHPVQLKFDRHYNLYVVDRNNSRIQRFDLSSNGC